MTRILDATVLQLASYGPKADQLLEVASLLASIGTEPAGGDDGELTFESIAELRDAPQSALRKARSAGARIAGFDGILLGDWESDFRQIKSILSEDIAFCPKNGFGMATAAAIAWAQSGGNAVVASFGGIGGYAALEEVAIALVLFGLNPKRKYTEFALLKPLMEEIAGMRFGRNKAATSSEIFTVKSGIHVDGILKCPECYLPYSPEDVGSQTQIAISKQSGRSAIAFKLGQLAMECSDLDALTEKVKQYGEQTNAVITDLEFLQIALGANEAAAKKIPC